MRSCVLPFAAIKEAKTASIKVMLEREPHPLQEDLIEHDVAQCGYCQSAQILPAFGIFINTDLLYGFLFLTLY